MAAQEIDRTSTPNQTQDVRADSFFDDTLSALIGQVNPDDLPATTVGALTTLTPVVLLPVVAHTICNIVQIVHDVTQVAADIAEVRAQNCICEQLTRIADSLENPNRLRLYVTITQIPVNLDIIPGQGPGPAVYFPVGWLNFGNGEFWFERQFINHPKQVFDVPPGVADLQVAFFRKPGIQLEAVIA